ncbi:MAG: hypothetical protein R3B96_23345 [Pirellulaceae bacterium]
MIPESSTGPRVRCSTTLTFTYPLSEDGLRQAIRDVANDLNLSIDSELATLTPGADEQAAGTVWVVEIVTADQTQVERLLTGLQEDLRNRPYFSSLAEVGGQIAEDAQLSAAGALFVSLVGIVLYIWIRFQKVAYGLAAVIALVHDVLMVLERDRDQQVARAGVRHHPGRELQDQRAGDRRVPDGDRLLAQRYDRRVRPYP